MKMLKWIPAVLAILVFIPGSGLVWADPMEMDPAEQAPTVSAEQVVAQTLYERGVDAESINDVLADLSPAEMEYFADNPEQLQVAGAPPYPIYGAFLLLGIYLVGSVATHWP